MGIIVGGEGQRMVCVLRIEQGVLVDDGGRQAVDIVYNKHVRILVLGSYGSIFAMPGLQNA